MSRPADITRTILLSLLAGGAIGMTLASPGGARRLIRAAGRELKRAEERRRFFWTVAYLRRKKYLDYRESKDGTVSLALTEDGRKRALRYHMGTLALPRLERWDGKWRVIAFDIPERSKRGRDALRGKMKELGCVQLQKSMWVWPYECRAEIDFIAEVFNVGPYVHYLVAESITSEKFLKYKFRFL